MKTAFLFSFMICFSFAYSQNEFAAVSFYKAFRKVNDDARNGFSETRGDRLKSTFEDLHEEYKVTVMLPLADSGKLIVPAGGNPRVSYYFEPEKKKQKVDERAVHLRDAILVAYEKPLFARTITTTLGKRVQSDTYLFAEDHNTDIHVSKALYRISVYYKHGKYQLVLDIQGQRP